MPGKRYSAGAIFLQVVPVFGNVQRAIEDEAKNIDRALGDSMERSGKKAGERAGKAASKAMNDEVEKGSRSLSGTFEREFHKSVDEVNKALGGIDIKRLSNDMRREVSSMKKELSGLKDVDITADADFKRVYAEIAVLEGRLLGFRDGAKIVFRSDIDEALKGIAKIKAAKEKIDDPIDIEVRVETKAAERSISLFEQKFKKSVQVAGKTLSTSLSGEVRKIGRELDDLGDLKIGIDLSGGRARAEMKQILKDLDTIATKDPDIEIRLDAAAAASELRRFEAQMEKLDDKDVTVDVKADTKQATQNAQDASNVFRSFNIILLATASVGPALIPVLAGIAGGLLALGPAAAVAAFGLSSVLVGFSGLGDAVGALGAQQDAAATTAQTSANRQVGAAKAIENAQEALSDARRNAARAAEDAAERVADAREAAADSIEDALERQKDAQEEYRDAVQDVRDAEQDLRDAREEARKDAETLAKRQRQNAVDERQAVLDLGAAQNEYNAVMADGSSTNTDKEQASVNLEQAQLALNDTRDEQVALADEAADYAANGVDGSEKVKSAQEQVTEALEAQKDAQEAVKEAAEAADEARVDGAKAVQDALEDQAETIADNARAIQDAKEGVADARESAVRDLQQIDAQAQAVKTAFDKLGPAGRDFALFLFSMRSGFYAFRDDVQKALLPAVQQAIESFISSPAAGKAKGVFVALAAGFGEFVKALSQSFQGPVWTAFFEMMADLGPKIQAAYGGALISFLEAFASILTTTAPFALRFAEGLEKMMDRFADWADSKAGADAIKGFIAFVEEVGPSVLDFFGGLAGALVAVVKAMAPYGSIVLDVIDQFLAFITVMDSDLLGALLTGLTVVVLASQVAYGLSVLAMSLGALFATTIGPWIFLIVGVIAALVILYKTNEDFRNFVVGAWDELSKVISKAWEEQMKPALMGFWEAVQNLWKEVLQPFLEWAGPMIVWFAKKIVPLLAWYFSTAIKSISWMINNILIPVVKLIVKVVTAVFKGIEWAWENVLKPAWDAISAAVTFLWENVFKPVFGFIWDVVSTVFGAIVALWTEVLWPVFETIGGVVMDLYQLYFKVAFVLIKAAWKALGIAFEAVWNNIIKPLWTRIKVGATAFYQEQLKPAFDGVKKAWDAMAKGLKTAWDKWGQPIFDWIVENALPPLKTAFEETIGAIGTLWDGLKKMVGTPIKFVIEKVINEALIGGFNKIAGWVNAEGIDPIKTPEWMANYATGGVLPGYTPGRDVHTFRSPTAGTLNLSGGEAIMRPEWTAAMGPSYVDQMNAIARSKGVGGIRKAMGMGGSYSFGGVLPGASVSSHGASYGFPAYDLNYPGYADYGQPVGAYKKGIVTGMNYIGDASYGRWVTLMHEIGKQSTLYAHLSAFAANLRLGDTVAENQTIGYVGDIGNTGNPPTSHLHFEIRGGDIAGDMAGGITGPKLPKVPEWAKAILSSPVKWAKGLIQKPIENFKERFGGGQFVDMMAAVPGRLVGGVGDFAKDMLTKAFKAAKGVGDKLIGNPDHGDPSAPGQEIGPGDSGGGAGGGVSAYNGGILPYNGTMMYDNGGYLPPGMTTVMNLTGKPEPVFTDGQFDDLGVGGGENFTYAPTFEGSNLTAADVVDDFDFTRRKIKREGAYGRHKP